MDTKLQTFLTLCRLMNYRLTAEELHLTQPAVTKQIQSLEQIYQTKLFIYDGKKLHKTKKCSILEKYCESLQYNYDELKEALNNNDRHLLRIGATKTIGDYALTPKIVSYSSQPENELSLIVDNTEKLLTLLDNSELDFAVIEGFFNKNNYDYILLQNEPFIGICSKNHRFANSTVSLDELFKESLIVRETGSGTRNILEHELKGLNYDFTAFSRVICISSFKLIRELVLQDVGISFVYKSVIEDNDDFSTFTLENFNHCHEFNIVYLKNTFARKYVEKFFSF